MYLRTNEISEASVVRGLNDLPLIICGPLLRKVYYDHVSVWIAFKEEVSDIKLYVFETADPRSIGPGAHRLTGLVASPLKLGKNLYVTLVTATSTTQKLKPDTIYGYNIFFTHKGVQKQLGYRGVLKDGVRSISYAPFTYPTFCLPADNINNLKITHGSCRKPHGGRTDALRALDTMLEIHKDNVKERPQLLCLTGDQIYADDVSDLLLYKIIKTRDLLFGWKETLPKKYTDSQLLPGNRKDIIAKTGNKNTKLRRFIPFLEANAKITPDDLTTTDAKSHLIFLSEFILMYLFTFSDTFLTASGWPSFQDLYTLSPDREERSRQIASFNIEKSRLNSFVHGLRFVKRALANISTLMIFDDHDITDDWFITKKWASVSLMEGTTSRRYILNGLLAYAIFQDWGNDYTKYLSGNGLSILKALELNNTENYPNRLTGQVSNIFLPKLFTDTKNKSTYLQGPFKWDYRIDYNSFILLVMNTRTEREYFDKEYPIANLVRNVDLHGSVNSDKLLVLVSATPVFGNLPLEKWQEQFRKGTADVVTYFASRIFSDNIGAYERDQEAWAFSGEGFTKLLTRLGLFKKVLILSGDVHYAFTSYIRLWKQTGTPHRLTEIVQSTSSALKNSTEQTHFPARDKYGLRPKTDNVYKRLRVLAIKKPGSNYEERDNATYQNPNEYNPQVTRIPLAGVRIDPRFQYTVKFIQSPPPNSGDPLFQKIKTSEQSKSFTNPTKNSSIPLVVVGKDNISLLSFSPRSITNSIWFASGNYEKPDDNESHRLLFPYVKHKIEFNSNFKEEELPAETIKRIFSTIPSPKSISLKGLREVRRVVVYHNDTSKPPGSPPWTF